MEPSFFVWQIDVSTPSNMVLEITFPLPFPLHYQVYDWHKTFLFPVQNTVNLVKVSKLHFNWLPPLLCFLQCGSNALAVKLIMCSTNSSSSFSQQLDCRDQVLVHLLLLAIPNSFPFHLRNTSSAPEWNFYRTNESAVHFHWKFWIQIQYFGKVK